MPTPTDAGESPDGEKLSAVQKAFRIVEALCVAGVPVTMSDVERMTGLARPTLHRVTNMLIAMGYVERSEEKRTITEGRRLVALALDVLRSSSPRTARLEVLKALARDTGESCHFAILSGSNVRLVDQVGAPVPLGVRYDGHGDLPAHATACGKLLLALLPEKRRNRLLGELTGLGVAERRKLGAALAEIASTSVGTEDGEHIAGVGGLAVPVRLPGGRTIGALGLAGPIGRLGAGQQRSLVPLLQAAAARLGVMLDGGGQP